MKHSAQFANSLPMISKNKKLSRMFLIYRKIIK